MAETRELQIILNAQDNASATIKSASQGIRNSISNTIDEMGRVGAVMTAAVTAPIVKFGIDCVQAFEAQELASARLRNSFQAVGGITAETAKQMEEYSAQLQNTTTFSDESITSGMALLGTFAMTTGQVQQLTPAMLDAAAALEKTTGQAPDMEQLATVMGKAVTTGNLGMLKKWGLTLTESQQAAFEMADTQGRVNILTEAFASNYGGQAAAQAQTLTGQWRMMKNQLVEVQESFGKIIMQALMPLVDHVKNFVKTLQNLSPEQQKMIVGFLALAAAIGPLLLLVKGLAVVFGVLFSPIGLIIAAIILLYVAWINNWGGIQEKVRAVWAFLQPILSKMWEWLKVHIPAAIQWFRDRWEAMKPTIQKISDILNKLATFILPYLKMAWDKIAEVGRTIINEFKKHPEIWEKLGKVLLIIGGIIIGTIVVSWVAMAVAITAVVFIIMKIVEWIMKLINWTKEMNDKSTAACMNIINWFRNLWQAIVNVWNMIVDAVANAMLAAWNWVNNVINNIRNIWNSIVGAVSGAFSSVYNTVADWLNRAWDYVVSIVNRIRDKLSEIGGSIKGALNKIPGVSLQRGGYVYEGGMYMLHQGERVVPSYTNKNEYNNTPNISINVPKGSSGADIAYATQRQLERANYGALWR